MYGTRDDVLSPGPYAHLRRALYRLSAPHLEQVSRQRRRRRLPLVIEGPVYLFHTEMSNGRRRSIRRKRPFLILRTLTLVPRSSTGCQRNSHFQLSHRVSYARLLKKRCIFPDLSLHLFHVRAKSIAE